MIGQKIYQMFYVGAQTDGVIWTIEKYADRKGLEYSDGDPYTNSVIQEHGRAIEEVLFIEISIYVFRRLNGTWGEVIDGFDRMRSKLIKNYREKTGFDIDTGNDFY